MHEPGELWAFLPWGFLLSVVLETPVLLVGLSPRHPLTRRLFCGVWLTACTYPMVALVLPLVVRNTLGEAPYLILAETFAPLAECLLFWLAYDAVPAGDKPSQPITRGEWLRDMGAIVAANLTSFGLGWALMTMF